MNKHKNSVEEAIDLILNEETVGNLQPGEFITKEMPCPKATENNVRYPKMNKNHGMMDVFEGKKGKKYEKQPLPEEDAEEDAESVEYDSYSNSIRSWLDSNYGKTGTVYDISRIFTPDETRTVMKVLQQMANKGEITIDHSTVKLNPVSESSLFVYSSSENDTDDDEEQDDDECRDKKCKEPAKKKNCSEDAEDDDDEGEDVKAAEEIYNGGAEYTLKDAVKDYFESSVSGSVGGVRLNSAIKDIKEKTGVSKPRIIEVIKELLKSKELVKGPDGNTLIYNSKAEKNNEDDEIINMQSTTSKNQNQPISNKETPQTLKAKGWKDNGNGLFVSPDNKQQFIFSNESKTININTMNNRNNKFDFDLLVEEFGEELEKMNTEQDLDQTAGLDELSDDEGLGDTDEIEDDGDEVQVTLTKSEARLLSDLASKLSSVLGDTEDDMVDDEATDEAANADLMGDDEVSFDDTDDDTFEDDTELDDEEDSEELSDNSGAYTGSYNNQGASMSRSNASYGNERRKPIEGGYKPSAHGSAKEVTYGPTGASLSKHNGSYGKERRDPVPSRNTSLANSKRSIFD